jgi:GTPase SAR1 family protein
MLDQYLESDKKKFNEEIKLLLLGAGESGKSTIFKQMKILQDNGGYTQKELEGFRYVIHGNCITQMKLLVEAAIKSGAHMDESLMQSANRIREVPTTNVGSSWSDQLAKDIVALWKSDTIQTVFRDRDGTFQLNDSMDYFFSNVDRFNQINYVPTVEDVLRARVRSLGIEEAEFMFESVKFRMVDVGGQRSERRKWIHCFDHVSAVIFCVALSEYDQVLREEEGMNRMKESLLLWEEIVNSKHFRTTPFILFLNKTDLFREKLKKIPLTSVYPNFMGGDDFEAASNFIKARYIELNQYPHEIFSHFTCAISTENIGFVFGAVRKTLLKQLISEHTI